MSMNIYQLDSLNTDEFDEKDLLNYLSQVVISLTDDEIKQTKQKLTASTNSLAKINQAFKDVKKTYESKTSEYAKSRQLKRVLLRIETLNKEGSIRGKNKTSIIQKLTKIKKLSFSELSKLEEALTLYQD